MSDQMIFKRYEIKYMINKAQFEMIRKEIAPYMMADVHGRSTILSLYFDTPDYLLVRRSLEHPVYKEKLRLRSYGTADSDSLVFVELKKKYDSIVYKRRIAMTEQNAADYLIYGKPASDSQITREIDYFLKLYEGIQPSVLLSYQREAFYSNYDHDFRITFDSNILWRNYDLSLCKGIYGMPLLENDQILMEIKTAGAIPLWLTRILSREKIFKTSFSKYGSAYKSIFVKKKNGGFCHYA